MSELSIRSDRIKRIDIKDGETVLGTAVFNPYDMAIYKQYTGIRATLAKDKQEYDRLVAEYQGLDKDVPEEDLLEAGEYEKLDALYQHEIRLGEGIDTIFSNLKDGIDAIFGAGIYDLMMQGYQDEGMLEPLFQAAQPFFAEAGKERGEKLEAAKLNREQRRAKLKEKEKPAR